MRDKRWIAEFIVACEKHVAMGIVNPRISLPGIAGAVWRMGGNYS